MTACIDAPENQKITAPAADEAEQHRSIGQAEMQQTLLAEQQDDREDHRRGADDGGADEHRLGGGLEGVAGRVVRFEIVLAALEVRRRSRSRVWISSLMPGMFSVWASSKTDWALSVTGP